MKQLLQNMRDGTTTVVEIPAPTVKPGMVLVKTAASLVSAGTERSVVEFAEKSLVGKARSRPDLVKQVLDKARREGLLSTVDAAFNRLDQPLALGYSSAGTIVEVGAGVEGYQVGDRVVCAGGGYAVHADYAVVPTNLVAPLPDSVDFEAGAFATVGAIALHGFRLSKATVGEDVIVIGLGLLGLLSVNIALAAGCRVFGIDVNPERVKLAQALGAEASVREGAETAALAFSAGRGADVVLICAGTASHDPVTLAGEVARDKGRVVSIGVVGTEVPRPLYYAKELEFVVSRSYGPGRHDADYEDKGQDYPLGFVRWTIGRNLESFVQMMEAGRMPLESLITHRFPIEQATAAYDVITGKTNEPFLGVLLTYAEASVENTQRLVQLGNPTAKSSTVQLGVLGAGNFALATLLPAIKKNPQIGFQTIASAAGVSAHHAAKKFGFSAAASDAQAVISDPTVNTLAILTRHDLHAAQVVAGLQAGKHVFCEKPIALNEAELEQIETALADSDRYLFAGFNRRFAPFAVQLKAFIDQRSEPLWAHYRVNAGFIPASHWLHDPVIGGGRIIGESVHFVDFLTYLVGAPPSSVVAQALPDGGRYHQDNVQITLTFPDGSLGVVSYLANGDKSVGKERVEVFSGGRVGVLDDYRKLELVANGRRKVQRNWLRQDKGHRAEWEVFAETIRSGGPPPIPYTELFGVHRAVFGAVKALQTGENVKL